MIKTHAFRLTPRDDLKNGIEAFVKEKNIAAGWIACGVGSLTEYNIRFANQSEGFKELGYFEIVTLIGTVSLNGCHIHISICDGAGRTIGGHLLEGNRVYTTAEIIIQETDDLLFDRELDEATGWKELKVEKRKKQ